MKVKLGLMPSRHRVAKPRAALAEDQYMSLLWNHWTPATRKATLRVADTVAY